MRRTGNPSVVAPDGKHVPLTRVEYADRAVAEDFLQDSLNKSPQILPVEEIDPAFAPLISLGREVDSIPRIQRPPTSRHPPRTTRLEQTYSRLSSFLCLVIQDPNTLLHNWTDARGACST